MPTDVVVMMASGCEIVAATIDYLVAQGKKVGMVIVRLYRPFDCKAMVNALPPTVERITVLDRTKEPGAPASPSIWMSAPQSARPSRPIVPPISR